MSARPQSRWRAFVQWCRAHLAVLAAGTAVAGAGGVMALSSGGGIDVFVGSTPTPTATATGTPTPTPTPDECPNPDRFEPDGPDESGDCWPGDLTAGLSSVGIEPDELDEYTGPCTFWGGSGTVTITEKRIDCRLENTFGTTQVVIVRSELNGGYYGGDWEGSCSRNLTISDSDVNTAVSQGALYFGDRGLEKNCFNADNLVITGGISCGWVEYSASVSDSYCGEQGVDQWGCTSTTGTRTCLHQSGFRLGSGSGQVIEHNTIECKLEDVPPVQPGGPADTSGCSGGITGYGDFGEIQNNTVENNLFTANKGGVCNYGGNSTPKTFPNGGNNVFQHNYYVARIDNGKCGGNTSSSGHNLSISGNVFDDNWLWNGSTLTELEANE